MISGVRRGGWHAGTMARDASDADVTISSFPWFPAQPSSLLLLLLPVVSGTGTMLFVHTPPCSGDLGLDYALSVLLSIQE